ncbi:hypothetical protein IH781_01160 [Patescibacteria group bacterium]|nr:hypothetical protein [Patescibacteria group bacterium]
MKKLKVLCLSLLLLIYIPIFDAVAQAVDEQEQGQQEAGELARVAKDDSQLASITLDPGLSDSWEQRLQEAFKLVIPAKEDPRLLKISFKTKPFDRWDRQVSEEELCDMVMADRRWDGDGNRINMVKVLQSQLGTFTQVRSHRRYSIDPEAHYRDAGHPQHLFLSRRGFGPWHDMVQFPGGKWVRGYPNSVNILRVATIDEETFLFTRQHIVRWLGAGKFESVVQIGSHDASLRPYLAINRDSADGSFVGRFYAVATSKWSHFGGLLECRLGAWRFYRYTGRHKHWVEAAVEKDGVVTLGLFKGFGENKRQTKVSFNPATGEFKDL